MFESTDEEKKGKLDSFQIWHELSILEPLKYIFSVGEESEEEKGAEVDSEFARLLIER